MNKSNKLEKVMNIISEIVLYSLSFLIIFNASPWGTLGILVGLENWKQRICADK